MLIDVNHLTKCFGPDKVVSNATFSVDAGERVAIVGRNGAGKTTLLRLLATFLPPTSGYAKISGFDLLSRANAIRSIIGYLPEQAPLCPDMTVTSYLRYRGKLRRLPRQYLIRRLHEVVDFCNLAAIRDARIQTLSNGRRHAVALADSILHEPDVLLFDDPLVGADPDQTEKLTELMTSPIVSDGRAILFVTHNIDLVRTAATRIICLNHGSIIADTSDLSVLRNKSLAELFRMWTTAAETPA